MEKIKEFFVGLWNKMEKLPKGTRTAAWGVAAALSLCVAILILAAVFRPLFKPNKPEIKDVTPEKEESVVNEESSAKTESSEVSVIESAPEAEESSSLVELEEKQEESVVNEPKMILGGVPDTYFDDALFIGDSRTVGLYQSGAFEKSVFMAKVGVGIEELTTGSFELSDGQEYTLEELLKNKKFSKVYIMAGINDIFYDTDYILKDYKTLLNLIQKNSDAVIYVQSNIGVTENFEDDIYTKEYIDAMNDGMKKMCDGEKVIYLDIAGLVSNKDGYLDDALTVDGMHLASDGIARWAYYLKTHAYILEENAVVHNESEIASLYKGIDPLSGMLSDDVIVIDDSDEETYDDADDEYYEEDSEWDDEEYDDGEYYSDDEEEAVSEDNEWESEDDELVEDDEYYGDEEEPSEYEEDYSDEE